MEKEIPKDSRADGSHVHPRLDRNVITKRYFVETPDGLVPVSYSYVKVIKTGNHIEIHEAEYPFILDRPSVKKQRTRKGNKKRSYEYRLRTAKRAMDRIRRLSFGNFKPNKVKHLVLTFRDGLDFDITNISECNNRFNNFAQKLHRKVKNLMYIKVAEFQDKNGRGAVHFHVMCNLPFIDAEKIEKWWGYGFIKIREAPYDISKYLFKYLIKNAGDIRYKGKRSWSHSNNLVSSKFLYKSDANRYRAMLTDKNMAPFYAYSYKSDYNGYIHVYEYDLENPIPRAFDKPVQPIKDD